MRKVSITKMWECAKSDPRSIYAGRNLCAAGAARLALAGLPEDSAGPRARTGRAAAAARPAEAEAVPAPAPHCGLQWTTWKVRVYPSIVLIWCLLCADQFFIIGFRTSRRGMHLFEDFAATASGEHLRAVRDLQREIQMDDPMQMMFTSGSFIMITTAFAVFYFISKS